MNLRNIVSKRNCTIITIVITGVVIMKCTMCKLSTENDTGKAMPFKSKNINKSSTGEFYDIDNTINWSVSDIFSSAREFFFSRNHRSPDHELPRMPLDMSHFSDAVRGSLTVTWLGHSSLMVNTDGYKILIDPVFEKRISLIGPTRYNGDVPLDINQLPQIDAVIISHDHYDHLNKFSIRYLISKTSTFIVPVGVGAMIAGWGVPHHKIIELNWWEEYKFSENLLIVSTPSQHFSGRGLTDRNSTLVTSWVIATACHKLFFSGDTGYFEGLKLIGEKYGPFDITFIECGAYNEKWSNLHLFPEQTVQAHLDLKGKILHPIHWGTFNLSMHPWYEPMERLSSAAEKEGVQIATPVVGETTIYGKFLPAGKWWQQAMLKQINGAKKKSIAEDIKSSNNEQ